MFGVTKKEHDARYAQGEEWWSIVKRIWAGEARSTSTGTHYQLRGVEGSPRPYGGRTPLMMNAGSSPAGSRVRDPLLGPALRRRRDAGGEHGAHRRDQAAGARARSRRPGLDAGRHRLPPDPEGSRRVPAVHRRARRLGRDRISGRHAREGRPRHGPIRSVWCTAGDRIRSSGGCWRAGPTARSAIRTRSRESSPGSHAVGFDGLALNFVDYLKELPYFAAEVLPRLERLGLRAGSP